MLIPRANIEDVLIEERYQSMVTIIPVDHIEDVLKIALVPENREGFLNKLRKMASTPSGSFLDTTGIPTSPA